MPAPSRFFLEYSLTRVGGPTAAKKPIVFVGIDNADSPQGIVVIPAVVDSGSDSTCISKRLALQLGHVITKGKKGTVTGVSGASAFYAHNTSLRLVAPGVPTRKLDSTGQEKFIPCTWKMQACVIEKVPLCLLGCSDFLRGWEFQLDVGKGVFRLIPRFTKLRKAVEVWLESHKKPKTAAPR